MSFSNQTMRQPCMNKPHIQLIDGKWRVSSWLKLGDDEHRYSRGNDLEMIWKWNVSHGVIAAWNTLRQKVQS